MANPEHLAVLKKGVDSWNEWRQDNPSSTPDLQGADLSGIDLSGFDRMINHEDTSVVADLRGAQLQSANLRESRLTHADLIEANLSGANLSYADLSGATLNRASLVGATLTDTTFRNSVLNGADLHDINCSQADFLAATCVATVLTDAYMVGASFRYANLTAADLCGADLRRVDLCWSNLDAANLMGARMGRSIIGLTDLSKAIGLEKVQHDEPSVLGIDAIYQSAGKIAKAFLRGCGVPDDFIEFAGSIRTLPVPFYSCFISYSSKDQTFATRLHGDLQSKGVRCWFAPEDLRIGDKLRPSFDAAIRTQDKLLVLLSKKSVKSEWVEKEVETAFEIERQQNRIVLFPIRLDNAVMETDQAWAADIRRTRHIGDFRSWKNHDSYKKALDRLLRDLKAEGKSEPPAQDER